MTTNENNADKSFLQFISGFFIQQYQALYDTELLWEDEESYFILNDYIERIANSLANASDKEIRRIFDTTASDLLRTIHAYKKDMTKKEILEDREIQRLEILNRIVFLLYIFIKNITNKTKIAEYIISDKLVQRALISGLNGPNHELFFNELIDEKKLISAVDFIAHSRPVVKKYGKAVSAKDKAMLAAMSAAELGEIAKKLFKENEIQFLSRVPEYKNGFLLKLK